MSTGPIASGRLAICEGPEDHCLIRKLREVRAIRDFHALTISDAEAGGGYQALGNALPAISRLSGFRQNVQNIAVIIDADDDPIARFEEAKTMIALANQNPDSRDFFPEPVLPFVQSVRGNLTLTLLLMPGKGATGCLETLLWPILTRLYPAATTCVDTMIACSAIETNPPAWNASKVLKAKVRATLSIVHKRDPAIALSRLWTRAPDVIPATSPEFDELAAILESF